MKIDKFFPIEALVAIVERETAIIRGDICKYGEHSDPMTPAYLELRTRMEESGSKAKEMKK